MGGVTTGARPACNRGVLSRQRILCRDRPHHVFCRDRLLQGSCRNRVFSVVIEPIGHRVKTDFPVSRQGVVLAGRCRDQARATVRSARETMCIRARDSV